MKLRKFGAAAVAAVLAASSTAICAFAEDDLFATYDAAAARANNDSFELGGKIDLYDALGDKWNMFTKVEADFTWDAGTAWCGGAGIGGGADVEGGSGWIAGPEFGAANANAGVVDDGKATQTLIDLNGATLAQVAAANEDGSVAFGEMQVQKWWNCDEANAKATAIRFLDASGAVVTELYYGDAAEEADEAVEEPAEEETIEEAPATGDVDAATDSSKGSPDTGVADVAAVAGLGVLAAGAIIFAKKRR